MKVLFIYLLIDSHTAGRTGSEILRAVPSNVLVCPILLTMPMPTTVVVIIFCLSDLVLFNSFFALTL